jgi:hypothetical protein
MVHIVGAKSLVELFVLGVVAGYNWAKQQDGL